jgi:hypothetical protein
MLAQGFTNKRTSKYACEIYNVSKEFFESRRNTLTKQIFLPTDYLRQADNPQQ